MIELNTKCFVEIIAKTFFYKFVCIRYDKNNQQTKQSVHLNNNNNSSSSSSNNNNNSSSSNSSSSNNNNNNNNIKQEWNRI